MPDPIRALVDPTLPPEITNEEDEARMSLISAHPDAAPPSPSPGVTTLVTRFTKVGTAPPPEPSLAHALLNCKLATFTYVANTATIVAAAPDSFGLSFVLGAARIAATSVALSNCIQQDEASQIANATRENAVTACHNDGGTPLNGADGSVVCAK